MRSTFKSKTNQDSLALGHKKEAISDYARYKALESVIAVTCTEYIMAGIAETL